MLKLSLTFFAFVALANGRGLHKEVHIAHPGPVIARESYVDAGPSLAIAPTHELHQVHHAGPTREQYHSQIAAHHAGHAPVHVEHQYNHPAPAVHHVEKTYVQPQVHHVEKAYVEPVVQHHVQESYVKPVVHHVEKSYHHAPAVQHHVQESYVKPAVHHVEKSYHAAPAVHHVEHVQHHAHPAPVVEHHVEKSYVKPAVHVQKSYHHAEPVHHQPAPHHSRYEKNYINGPKVVKEEHYEPAVVAKSGYNNAYGSGERTYIKPGVHIAKTIVDEPPRTVAVKKHYSSHPVSYGVERTIVDPAPRVHVEKTIHKPAVHHKKAVHHPYGAVEEHHYSEPAVNIKKEYSHKAYPDRVHVEKHGGVKYGPAVHAGQYHSRSYGHPRSYSVRQYHRSSPYGRSYHGGHPRQFYGRY